MCYTIGGCLKGGERNETAFSRLLQTLYRCFLASALCILLSSVFSMLVPQTMRFAIDSVLDGKASFLDSLKGTFSNIQLLTLLALAAVVFALLNMVFSFLFKYLVSLGSEGVIKDMRDGLYRHIAALPYSYFGRIETGELVQKCTLDVDVVKGFLIRQLPEVLRTAAVIVTSVSFIFYTNVLCGVISIIFIPIIALYSGVFFKNSASVFKKRTRRRDFIRPCAGKPVRFPRCARFWKRAGGSAPL